MAMFKIAITNLGKYAEGELVFKWVDLTDFSCADDFFESGVFKEIGIGSPRWDGSSYDEWFISDIDCDIPGVGPCEHPSNELLDTWIEVACEWENLDIEGEVAVSAWIEDQGSFAANTLEGIWAYNYGRLIVHEDCSKEDVVRQWLADGEIFEQFDFDQRNYLEPFLDFDEMVDWFGNDRLIEYYNDVVEIV